MVKKRIKRKKVIKNVKTNVNNIKRGLSKKKHIGKLKSVKKNKKMKIDVSAIAEEIKAEQIRQQRKPLKVISKIKSHKRGSRNEVKKKGREYVKTGVEGFDELLEQGIPKGNSVIVAGGAGSGKTIFCLQTLAHHAKEGKKCLYMTFEESEEDLIDHMESFGWDAKKLIKKGRLKIQRFNPFDITRNVDALLAQQKGELLIEIDPVIIPKNFKPDIIVLDSLTAIASAFTNKDESYRIYIEQLFRFFEKIGANSFLITETEQIPKIFSTTGVEEFLAGGVVVLYNLKHGNVRENALEILKLRGAAHQKKIVAYQITGQGMVVYPDQEVFSDI
jgi:circadian clock protein KaiC